METMINRHRPTNWDDVMGNRVAVAALKTSLSSRSSSAYLLTGPSGSGKTTIARLIAAELGFEYDEKDAATRTGVDDMRSIMDTMNFKPLSKDGRVICLDEAHMLSKSAWNSALKSIEQPPEHIVWVLCTTELSKVPVAIRNRCHHLEVSLTSDAELRDFIGYLEEVELDEERLDKEVVDAMLENANGAPRQLLSDFERVYQLCREDALSVLSTSTMETKEVFDLVRALNKGSWMQWMSLLKKIEPLNPMAVRAVALAYYTKVAMSKWSPRSLTILEAFRDPYTTSETHELLGSLGEIQTNA